MNTVARSFRSRRASTCAGAAGALLAGLFTALAAPLAPPNGPRQVDPRWHTIVHATLVPRPGETIEDATIVMRDGLIVSVVAAGAPPEGSRVWDCAGLTVYPGLIDAHVPVDAPKPDQTKPGAHWNDRVTPQRSALDGPGLDEKSRKELRSLGFTAAHIAPKGGVFRGSTALVLLDDPAPSGADDRATVVIPTVFHEVAFETGGRRGGSETDVPTAEAYPSSEMGAIALIRQTLLDADWHIQCLNASRRDPARHEPVAPSEALLALGRNENGSFALLFDTTEELQTLRAAKIAGELGRGFAVVGSGLEFRRLGPIASDKCSIIVPLNFPEKPKIASPSDAEAVDLRDLMTWEQAPTNPRRLDAAGVTVAITTDKLRRRDQFYANLRSAIEHGLSEDRALAMLTTQPAAILGASDRLGTVEPGRIANLVVTKGSLFDEDSKVRDVWIAGQRHEVTAAPEVELDGAWAATFNFATESFDGELAIEKGSKITVKSQDKEGKARNVTVRQNRISFLVDGKPWEIDGVYMLSAVIEGDQMRGEGVSPIEPPFTWTATRKPADASKSDAEGADAEGDQNADAEEGAQDAIADRPGKGRRGGGADEAVAKKKPEVPDTLPLPFTGYGLLPVPDRRDVIVTNATVWTCGSAGTIENGEIEVKDGKLAYVGRARDGARPSGATVIDAQRRHVTPGMIDCHSHSGISGSVNEGTQAVTCEVRIFDVIDPDDVAWYRELAGGLTAANQLHGSANPIGGQNSVVKIRWGCARPDDMRVEGAIAGVKFALGENVKQSNWGERFTTRYPQTRMGVETIIRDRFISARDYAAAWNRWAATRPADREGMMPPRRDLELEALAEILAGKRLIHCHSYRQDEILMLCRAAAEFGFTIGTFQHVLEGYKVAEAIRQAAIGGSSFSDWWAYKFEVYDAIPENGAIMHEVGVAVSFNSDSDELARRMNTEAAKAVKYGNVSPIEALKFVTLNPAKQLKIDDRTGSLEAGKDADFVIWSGDPLSAFSRCEATYVDGREMFSLARDAELRAAIEKERSRILQKVFAPDAGGGMARGEGRGDRPGQDPAPTERLSLMERIRQDAIERHYMRLIQAGIDPAAHRCGDCGMSEMGLLEGAGW